MAQIPGPAPGLAAGGVSTTGVGETRVSGTENVMAISTFCSSPSTGILRKDDTHRYMWGLTSFGVSTTSMASSSSSSPSGSSASSPLRFDFTFGVREPEAEGNGERSSTRLFRGLLCFLSSRLIVSAWKKLSGKNLQNEFKLPFRPPVSFR